MLRYHKPVGVTLVLLLMVLVPQGCTKADLKLGIHASPAPADHARGSLGFLPSYDPSLVGGLQMDLRGYDLSSLDLSDRLDDLLQANFDTMTRWPSSLPVPFDPSAILALGTDPGLGLRSLHEQGITGQGVGVAIIDQALLTHHVEYNDRLRYYDELHCLDDCAHMHGPAVASILVGKTVGVAPEADLYYIAETHGSYHNSAFEPDLIYVARSIDRLLRLNDALAPESRIRVISISVGWSDDTKGAAAADAALQRAREAGIFVITTHLTATYGFRFHGLERLPLADPNDIASYSPIAGWGYDSDGQLPPNVLCVPMASRTTAGPNGEDVFVFYRPGGWSWCVPYIAGLYALACQVAPDMTPDVFWAAALETGTPIDLSAYEPGAVGVVVDPVSLVRRLHEGDG